MAPKLPEICVIDNKSNSTTTTTGNNSSSIDGDLDNTTRKDELKPNNHNNYEQEIEYTFEDALNIIGFGRIHYVILLICGIIIMAVFNETMGMMIIVPASQCDLNLGPREKGFLSAIGFIGILLSSHLWGYLSDTIGRKKIIIYTLFGSNVFTLISCFISNYWLFVVIRLCAGICISGPSATVYAYLGEFNTLRLRPVVISLASAFVGVSTAYIPATAWLILPHDWSIFIYNGLNFRPWRLLLLLYTVPGFIAAICLIKIPESPKFMLTQGNNDEALKVIHWMFEINNNCGKLSKEFPIKKLQSETNKEYSENLANKKTWYDVAKSMWRQTIPLYKPPYLINFTICCVVQFGLFFISSGMGLWYPEIQNRINSMATHVHKTVCEVVKMTSNGQNDIANNSSNSSITTCNDAINTDVFVDSITLGMFYVIGYIILATFINRIGRKIILPAALLGSGLSGLSLHWVVEPIGIVILFCSFLMLAGMCVAIVNGAVVDLIPTHLRGMAVCISLMIGRLGGVVGSNIIGYLLEIDCNATFFLFSGFIMFCAFLTLFLSK